MVELALKISSYTSENAFTMDEDPLDSFWFTADGCTVIHERTPISSVLPGAEPILIDLGQWRVSIKLSGVAHKDFEPKQEQGSPAIRICRRNDLEMLGSNIEYLYDADYTFPATGKDDNWYNTFILFEDSSSKDKTDTNNDRGTNPYQYIIKAGNITIRTENTNSFVGYSAELVGYRYISGA